MLVGDDSSLARGWITGCLTLSGYEVNAASDGVEVLGKAEAESPEIILLDAVMPKLSGPEVWRKLKQSPETASIPVVLITRQDYVVWEMIEAYGGCWGRLC